MTVWPDADIHHRNRFRGRHRSHVHATTSEQALIDSTRDGDDEAFAALYERHRDAVERLARRLARDRHEADDVSSEVFYKTLRAIRSGHGPHDECRAYLLRSVRNTLINRRTRTDTGRTIAHADEDLGSTAVDALDDEGGPATDALRDVPERFRDVLWYVEVEGHDSTDLANRRQIAPPAASSLLYRARRALRRAYLSGAATRPVDGEACIPIRASLAAFVDGDVGTPSADRVRAHLAECAGCNEALDQMTAVYDRINTRGLLMLLPGALRSLLAEGGRSIGVAVGGTTTVLAATTLTISAVTMPNSDDEAPPPAPVVASPEQPVAAADPSPAPTTSPARPAPATETTPTTTAPPPPTAAAAPADTASGSTAPPPPATPATPAAEPASPAPAEQPTSSELPPPPATAEGSDSSPDAPGGVLDTVVEVVDPVVDTVLDVVTGVVGGVADVTQQVVGAVGDLADAVLGEDGLLGGGPLSGGGSLGGGGGLLGQTEPSDAPDDEIVDQGGLGGLLGILDLGS